jgi:hypothetical protein
LCLVGVFYKNCLVLKGSDVGHIWFFFKCQRSCRRNHHSNDKYGGGAKNVKSQLKHEDLFDGSHI